MAKKKTTRKRRTTHERPVEAAEQPEADAGQPVEDAVAPEADETPSEPEEASQPAPEPAQAAGKTPGKVEHDTDTGESLRQIEFHRRDNNLHCPRLLKVGMLTSKQGLGLNALLQTAQEQGAVRYVGHGNSDNLRQVPVNSHSDAIRWMLEHIAEGIEDREQ